MIPNDSSDEAEALRHRAQAEESIMDMLQSDIAIAARMTHLQDPFNARSQVSPYRIDEIANRPPPGYSEPNPTSIDELPEYTEATSSTINPDGSITIRPQSWSIFSGLNLADVSAMKLIPLPLVPTEVTYGGFYRPEYAESMHDALGELTERNTRSKSKSLLQILGMSSGENGRYDGFVRHIALMYGLARRPSQSHE